MQHLDLLLYFHSVLPLEIRVAWGWGFAWRLLGVEQIDAADFVDYLLVNEVLAQSVSWLAFFEIALAIGVEPIVEEGEGTDLVWEETVEFFDLLSDFLHSVEEINEKHLLVFSVRMSCLLHI